MDPQTQASFIPKKPLVSSPVAAPVSSGLLWLISLILFIASLVAAGAAFAYQQYLQSSIQSESASLARAQAAYDPTVIADIIRLDSRINQAQALLRQHTAPSPIFNLLESIVLSNSVRFSSFEYAINPNGTATIGLSGEALDFPSVALQSDAFGQTRALKDVLFSDINIDTSTGHVLFKVSAVVDPSVISYSNMLASQPSVSNMSGTSAGSAAADTAGSSGASAATTSGSGSGSAQQPFGSSSQ